ncbi:MAG: protein FdrA [Candidatus Nanopelagicales bacterium]
MSHSALSVHRGAYLDSLLLMATTVAMEEIDGVEWAGAFMGTARGLTDLATDGFTSPDLADLGANDLVLAVRAADSDRAEHALLAGRHAALDARDGPRPVQGAYVPRSLREAARARPAASVALVSVPGEYAALQAHHALSAGMHVLLFSDGVPVEEEVELKERAVRLGRLVMGPGAGTAILAGTGLGFANVLTTPRGPGAVGVVAAAGTGAQEVSTLLDRWGVPVSQVIGVGGRDLSDAVDGRMARAAVQILDGDDATAVILLVSKPASAAVAERVLAECRTTPAVAVFLGLQQREVAGIPVEPTLERGAMRAAELAGVTPPPADRGGSLARGSRPGRAAVRGLFSGGTLCYEAQLLLGDLVGPVHSNEPLRPELSLPAAAGAHVLLDLGAEEHTRGVPHPMIDLTGRLARLRELRDDPAVAVVLLDVVLGYGGHSDPAGQLAPVCADLVADGIPVVAYVLGTEGDPQGYSGQRATLEAAGCVVPATNARAACVAAAIALGRPELAAAG